MGWKANAKEKAQGKITITIFTIFTISKNTIPNSQVSRKGEGGGLTRSDTSRRIYVKGTPNSV